RRLPRGACCRHRYAGRALRHRRRLPRARGRQAAPRPHPGLLASRGIRLPERTPQDDESRDTVATHLLWINLVSDGAPTLALGVDPADPTVMDQRPRSRGERTITRRMWVGIVFVGAITAGGTLLVLDWSLPGGLIEGSGSLRY